MTVADVDTWAGGLFGLVLKTDDGGNTWVQQQALTDNIVNSLACTNDQTAWLAARGGNILRTTSPVAYAATPARARHRRRPLLQSGRLGLPGRHEHRTQTERAAHPRGEDHQRQLTPGSHLPVRSGRAAEGSWDVVVTNVNNLSYTLTGAFQVVSATRWYLAEGPRRKRSGNFETWILLQNPVAAAATVKLDLPHFERQGDRTDRADAAPQPGHGQRGGNATNDWSVATVAESDQPIIAENSLYWNQAERTSGRPAANPSAYRAWPPAGTWPKDRRERATPAARDLGIARQPRYRDHDGDPYLHDRERWAEGPTVDLAPGTRMSVNVADTLPNEWSVSTLVESEKPIMAERTLYWDTPDAGHARLSSTSSIGTIAPSMEWYLAEGSTGANDQGSFETWILVENPRRLRHHRRPLLPDADRAGGRALYRTTPSVPHDRQRAEMVPNEFSVSTLVKSNNPVVCERSTYWNTSDNPRWSATGSIGATTPSTYWDLAEGSTGTNDQGSFETWILIQNPLSAPAAIKITYSDSRRPGNRSREGGATLLAHYHQRRRDRAEPVERVHGGKFRSTGGGGKGRLLEHGGFFQASGLPVPSGPSCSFRRGRSDGIEVPAVGAADGPHDVAARERIGEESAPPRSRRFLPDRSRPGREGCRAGPGR